MEQIEKEKIYQEIKKEKNTKIKRELLKGFGQTPLFFYIMFSSFIIGEILTFLYMFVYNDVNIITKDLPFGNYSVILTYSVLNLSFTVLIFFFVIISTVLYHKSQSLIDNDNKK